MMATGAGRNRRDSIREFGRPVASRGPGDASLLRCADLMLQRLTYDRRNVAESRQDEGETALMNEKMNSHGRAMRREELEAAPPSHATSQRPLKHRRGVAPSGETR